MGKLPVADFPIFFTFAGPIITRYATSSLRIFVTYSKTLSGIGADRRFEIELPVIF
jgi:hypothetical protein